MATLYKTNNKHEEYLDYTIYEYNDEGVILEVSSLNGLMDDYDNISFDHPDAKYRYIVEVGIDKDLEDLQIGDTLNLNELKEIVSVKTRYVPLVTYCHISMTDPDGYDPISILNDGTEYVHIVISFKETEDSKSSLINVNTDLSFKFNSQNGIYDTIRLTFVGGETEFKYFATDKVDIIELDYEGNEVMVGDKEYEILGWIGNQPITVYRKLKDTEKVMAEDSKISNIEK